MKWINLTHLNVLRQVSTYHNNHLKIPKMLSFINYKVLASTLQQSHEAECSVTVLRLTVTELTCNMKACSSLFFLFLFKFLFHVLSSLNRGRHCLITSSPFQTPTADKCLIMSSDNKKIIRVAIVPWDGDVDDVVTSFADVQVSCV